MPAGKLILMLVISFLPLALLILSVPGVDSLRSGHADRGPLPSARSAGMVLAIIYRAMTFQRLRESVYLTVRTTAMVCWLFVGSYTFSSVFSYLGGRACDFRVRGLDGSHAIADPAAGAAHHLPARLAAGVVGDHHHLRGRSSCHCWHCSTSIPCSSAILVALNLQTSFLTPPMAMSRVLPEGHCATRRAIDRHLQGCPAVFSPWSSSAWSSCTCSRRSCTTCRNCSMAAEIRPCTERSPLSAGSASRSAE